MGQKTVFNPFTNNFDIINDGLPTIFVQPTEPTLATNGSVAIWEDTTNNLTFWVYRNSGGTQFLVEMST